MNELDDDTKTAACLMAMHGLTADAIALALGITEDEVQRYLDRSPDDAPEPPRAA